MQKFKPVTNEQLYLLPPSVEDFIPSGHLARVINDVVETIDVKAGLLNRVVYATCRAGDLAAKKFFSKILNKYVSVKHN